MFSEACLGMKTKLDLITKHGVGNKKLKFTCLIHLLNEDNLKECFHMLKKDKAAGIDEITWNDYASYLDLNIRKLVNVILQNPCPSHLHNN